MPVSPALAENLAVEVVAIYAEAERLLLSRIALHLGADMDAPDWVERKLLEVQFLARQTERLTEQLGEKAAAQAAVDLSKAYNRGGAAAALELAKAKGIPLIEAATPLYGLPPVEALVAETGGHLLATAPRILRSTLDAYRSVISETAGQVLVGAQTRRQAAQAALNRYASRGITGFVDKSGRGWNLESYAEMAMRTGLGRAAIQGHTEKLTEHGFDLVIVSDAPRECPLCAPWEGKVLSISGKAPDHPSVAQAHEAGLQHCNCRHSFSLYQEGVTRPHGETADPKGYAAGQKQRYLERQIRASKRLEAAAMDDESRKAAQARIRAYQAKLRDHVAANDLKRLRYREQIGRAI